MEEDKEKIVASRGRMDLGVAHTRGLAYPNVQVEKEVKMRCWAQPFRLWERSSFKPDQPRFGNSPTKRRAPGQTRATEIEESM